MGASLLVFKNKSDVPGCMSENDIREVCTFLSASFSRDKDCILIYAGVAIGQHSFSQMVYTVLLGYDRPEFAGGDAVDCAGCT